MNPVSARLLNQQLISQQFETASDLVEWMGAVQAQEYKMFRWAVGIRMKRPSLSRITEEFNSGKIVRLHLFRSTWQLVSSRYVKDFIRLCEHRNKQRLHSFLKVYSTDIRQYEYCKWRDAIVSILDTDGDLTVDEIIIRLKTIDADADKTFIRRILLFMEYDGLVCNGKLHSKMTTYRLLDKHIPSLNSPLTREEALSTLAVQYYQSHSPATLEDFVWWSGLSKQDAKTAMEGIKDEFETIRSDGTVFYIHKNSRQYGCRYDRIILLPPYDEYLIGYKSRYICLPEEFKHRAHDNKGIFHPIILDKGIVAGNWTFTKQNTDFCFFHEKPKTHIVAAEKQLKDIIKFYTDFQ